MIEFDIFLKISFVVLFTNIFNLPRLIIDLLGKIELKKMELRENRRIDTDSGVPYLLPKNVKNILDFNFKKRLKTQLFCVILSFAFVIIYLFTKDIPYISSSSDYICFVSFCSFLGLLPVFLSFVIMIQISFRIIGLFSR